MSLNTECRATPYAPVLSDERFIEGRAAVFYDPADPGTEYRFRMVNPSNPKGDPIEVRERIMPGAFDEALTRDDVRCLYNHEGLLGRRSPGRASNTLALSVDAKGLNYRCELPNHGLGQQVKESMTRGDLDGSSFQFVPREVPGAVTWRQESDYLVRELRALRLLDVAPVDFPAYKATTAGLRSEGRSAAEEQQLQELLTPAAPEPDRRQADADAIALFQLEELQRASMRLLQWGNTEARTDAASFESITQQLYRLLTASTGKDWLWPSAVYESFCVYEIGKPPVMYKQGYTVDNAGIVALSGDPEKVKQITTFEPA